MTQPNVIQSQSQSVSASGNATFASTPTAGSALVLQYVSHGYGSGGDYINAVPTDNQGNAWALLDDTTSVQNDGNHYVRQQIYLAPNVKNAATTVSWLLTIGQSHGSLTLFEIGNTSTTTPEDVYVYSGILESSSAGVVTTPATGTAQAGDTKIGLFGYYNYGQAALTADPAGGATILQQPHASGFGGAVLESYSAATTAATQTAAIKDAASPSFYGYVGAVICFKPSSTATVVSQTLTALWRIRKAVSEAKSLTWRIRNIVSQAKSATWRIHGLVNQARSAGWRIRNSVSEPKSATWRIRNAVTGTKSASWRIRTFVNAAKTASWRIRAHVVESFSASWQILSSGVVFKTISASWRIRNHVSSSKAATWRIRALVTASRSATWRIRGFVAKTVSASWKIRNQIVKSLVTTWRIAVEADEEFGTVGSTVIVPETVGSEVVVISTVGQQIAIPYTVGSEVEVI